MNIAIVVRRLNVEGGTQKLAAHLGRELRTQGNTVTFYTFFYSKDVCYPELLSDFSVVEADKAYVERMKKTGAGRGLVAFLRNYHNENQAARNLALKISSDTDVLNPHDQLAYRVSRYFKREVKNIPSIWTVNDVSTKKASLARNIQFNSSLQISHLKRVWYWCVDQFEYRWFIRYQDTIAVLDKRNKALADEEFPGITTVIIRGGLDAEEFPYQEHNTISPQKVRLLMFAVLLPHRRFEDGITALSILIKRGVNATLSIVGGVGDANYYRMLQALVHELRLEEKVHFKGRVSHSELLTEYKEADIFLFPCHLQTWGLAVFEAMASGLPVIVSETSGASEVLTDGQNAMVVPPRSPEKIADAVEKLIIDSHLYYALSVDGRKFVEENISWEKHAESMERLFKGESRT